MPWGNEEASCREKCFCSTLGGFQKLRQLLGANAFLCKGAPLDAGRADRPGVQMAALLASGIGLIGPDLDLLAAVLAPDILGFGRPYLYTSWASFFKHAFTLQHERKNTYDAYHTGS